MYSMRTLTVTVSLLLKLPVTLNFGLKQKIVSGRTLDALVFAILVVGADWNINIFRLKTLPTCGSQMPMGIMNFSCPIAQES